MNWFLPMYRKNLLKAYGGTGKGRVTITTHYFISEGDRLPPLFDYSPNVPENRSIYSLRTHIEFLLEAGTEILRIVETPA